MSYRLMADVLARSRAPGPARFVLIALADRMNKAGICWCSIADIADRTGGSARTIRRALRCLERIGELHTERRRGPRGANRYRITLPATDRPRRPGHSDRGLRQTSNAITPVTLTATPVNLTAHPGHSDRRISKEPLRTKNPERHGDGQGIGDPTIVVDPVPPGSARE